MRVLWPAAVALLEDSTAHVLQAGRALLQECMHCLNLTKVLDGASSRCLSQHIAL